MLICIDPGHGGMDPGATGRVSRKKIKESDIALSISLFLEGELSMLGHSTYITRRTDRTLSLYARSGFANRYGVELYISIHCNSAQRASAEDIETWIHPFSTSAARYAESIQASLVNIFPKHKDRGVKEADFHVLRETKMPAVLVETEFINNPKQARFLNSENNQQKIASAISMAIQ